MSQTHPPHQPASRRLRREIIAVLIVKLALLTALYFAFFATPPAQPDLAAHVLGPASIH